MKIRTLLPRIAWLVLLSTLPALVFNGCSSTPRIDWNNRIGNYTYDQAVADLGPPDRTAKLSDARTVAEWIRHTGSGVSLGLGAGSFAGRTGVGMEQSVGTGYNDHVLRLVFGPDNKLVEWKKNY
jgi:hypothetical protein